MHNPRKSSVDFFFSGRTARRGPCPRYPHGNRSRPKKQMLAFRSCGVKMFFPEKIVQIFQHDDTQERIIAYRQRSNKKKNCGGEVGFSVFPPNPSESTGCKTSPAVIKFCRDRTRVSDRVHEGTLCSPTLRLWERWGPSPPSNLARRTLRTIGFIGRGRSSQDATLIAMKTVLPRASLWRIAAQGTLPRRISSSGNVRDPS